MSESSSNPSADSTPSPVISYANPRIVLAASNRAAWRDGAVVVLPRGGELPYACVKCGEPPTTFLRRNLTWYPPIAYLGLVVGILPFGIIAVLLQKRATVMMPMCSRHLHRRKRSMLIAWVAGIAGVIIAVAGPLSINGAAYILAGVLVALASLSLGISVASPLRPKKIDPECSYLNGAGLGFLNQLPDGRMSDVQPIPIDPRV